LVFLVFFIISNFEVFNSILFKFLSTLGNLGVFYFILSTLGNLGVINFFWCEVQGSLIGFDLVNVGGFHICSFEIWKFSIFVLWFWGFSFYFFYEVLPKRGTRYLDFFFVNFGVLFIYKFEGLQFVSCHFGGLHFFLWVSKEGGGGTKFKTPKPFLFLFLFWWNSSILGFVLMNFKGFQNVF